MLLETSHIERTNDTENLFQAMKFYSKTNVKFEKAVLECVFTSIDKIEKRSCTMNEGGNSDFGPRFWYSCNYKDINHKLTSWRSCAINLAKGIDCDKCQKCLNWDV